MVDGIVVGMGGMVDEELVGWWVRLWWGWVEWLATPILQQPQIKQKQQHHPNHNTHQEAERLDLQPE